MHNLELQLLIILLSARLFAEIAVWIKAPPVIGELMAGIVLGPSLLGWLQPNEIIKLLAEIGIILLLFQVGLETDFQHLVKAGPKAFVVAIGGFILPFVLGFFLCHSLFSLPLLASLFVGGTLTATSIGITMRILSDFGKQHSHVGQIVLGAAVLDDVLGVIVLALLYEFSIGGGVSLANAGKIGLYVGVFFLLAPIAAKLIASVIKHYHVKSETPGLIPTTIVALVLFFAWLANVIGAPEILGGFTAGMALSRRFFLPFGVALSVDADFSKRIDEKMKPIVELFAPIFFVTVGLSLDLSAVEWSRRSFGIFRFPCLLSPSSGSSAGRFLSGNSGPRVY